MSLRIVADENIPRVEEAFAALGEVRTVTGRTLSTTDVRNCDLLLVRSVTRVDETLLAGSKVSFVASATIGEDHIDRRWLDFKGIGFASSPGCNADAAAEYVVTQVLSLASKGKFDIKGATAGIIGYGNVGSRVRTRLEALGIECLLNDPPREDRGEVEDWYSLEQLKDCDLITLHVPLTRSGPHPSYHLIDAAYLDKLKPGAVIINTSRGAAIDNAALLHHLNRTNCNAVLDVWESEPSISLPLLDRVAGASPHVAGYSLEGRLRGTQMIHDASCAYFDLDSEWSPWKSLPTPEPLTIPAQGPVLDRVSELILGCYNPDTDRQQLEALHGLSTTDRGTRFDTLRKHYPLRREFGFYPTDACNDAETNSLLEGLGFRLKRKHPFLRLIEGSKIGL